MHQSILIKRFLLVFLHHIENAQDLIIYKENKLRTQANLIMSKDTIYIRKLGSSGTLNTDFSVLKSVFSALKCIFSMTLNQKEKKKYYLNAQDLIIY